VKLHFRPGSPGSPGAPTASRALLAFAAALVAIAIAGAACSPGPTSTPNETPIAAAPSAWPSGTTGQYGLHIDPSLLGRLPRTVGAYPLVEDTAGEMGALDDADLARTFDRYAAAATGVIGVDDNSLQLVVGHFRPESQNADVQTAWISDYATGACSQANGISGTNQATINGWVVDVATCAGGPIVYSLSLGNATILSMYGLGQKDLGRMLIEALY
jgi:hypothetical protein